ncbi:hypothetical protein Tco_0592319, partial [Tanacetum coccineum]
DDDDFEDRINPGSHKDNPEVVDDDDDKEREKQDDEIENVTNDLIEANLKPCIVNTIIEDRDAFRSEVPSFVSQEFKTHAPKIITKLFKDFIQTNVIQVHPTTISSTPTDSSADLQYQLYIKMKPSLQDRVDNITLWEALRQWDAWEEENVVDKDEVILEDVTPELIVESQNVDKRVPTIFDHPRMEATLRDSLSNLFRNAKEYAYHLEQSTSFMENQIDSWHKRVYKQNQKKVRKNPEDYYSNHKMTEVVRIVTDQPHGLDFMEQILVMRANDKPDSFSKADFKYLNKNDIEDLYYLYQSKDIDNQKVNLMNSLITFIRSCVIWERFHDFQLGIENEPQMVLIYLNSKDEKRVMYLEEIVKFCDATLEKVLNEVKLRMFESKFLKKPPLLGELDQDIMKAYEREISKRLSHRQQMRRWESFVNGRPILPTMKRL